jgi:hypothetical protein
MRSVSSTLVLVGFVVSGMASLRADQVAIPTSARATSGGRTIEIQDAATVVGTYCAGCHNGVKRSPSGVLLDTFDTSRIAENRDVWIRAYRQLQAGTMPPAGASRPSRAGYDGVLVAIENALDAGTVAPPVSNLEIATRLASLLWNSSPDGPLADAAARNQLTDGATLERHVKRMLADGRAQAFVSRFFVPWLGLDQLAKADPDTASFPGYEVSLRDAMAKETELFLLSQLREDRDPIELWTANYTFLNAQLARHYGIDGVSGAQFRRVTLASPERAGLLGQGSVLMVTSRHQQGPGNAFTSPAARSMWVRMHFLGAPPPRPFPGAQPVNPDLPTTPQTRTLPAEPCVNCHRNFFPLGYALENFDPIGRWRTHDQLGPVDASGSLVDGTSTDGVVALRSALLHYPQAFRTTITEQLLAHAWGRPVKASRTTGDTLVPARQVLRRLAPARWSSIIAGVITARRPD